MDTVGSKMNNKIYSDLVLNNRPHVGQTKEETLKANVDELAALDCAAFASSWLKNSNITLKSLQGHWSGHIQYP